MLIRSQLSDLPRHLFKTGAGPKSALKNWCIRFTILAEYYSVQLQIVWQFIANTFKPTQSSDRSKAFLKKSFITGIYKIVIDTAGSGYYWIVWWWVDDRPEWQTEENQRRKKVEIEPLRRLASKPGSVDYGGTLEEDHIWRGLMKNWRFGNNSGEMDSNEFNRWGALSSLTSFSWTRVPYLVRWRQMKIVVGLSGNVCIGAVGEPAPMAGNERTHVVVSQIWKFQTVKLWNPMQAHWRVLIAW